MIEFLNLLCLFGEIFGDEYNFGDWDDDCCCVVVDDDEEIPEVETCDCCCCCCCSCCDKRCENDETCLGLSD